MADVLGFLAKHNIAVKPATCHNVHTHCVFCAENPTSRGRLYINVDPGAEVPGLYTCFLCGAKGNLVTLKRHFGEPVDETDLDTNTRADILNGAASYYHNLLDHYPDVQAYLKGPERGLTPDTITKHLIGYAPMDIAYDVASKQTSVQRSRSLYRHLRDTGYKARDILASGLCNEARQGKIVDALSGMVTIPYLVAGNCVAIRGRAWPYSPTDFEAWGSVRYDPPVSKYKTPGGTKARLFNTDTTWGESEVAVAEGEMDALVLEQAGFRAVGVPGANAWQEEWDGYLTSLKRLWIIFDRDPAGEKGATKLLAKFPGTARRVFLSPDGVKCDPTTWFQTHTASDFAELLAEANKGGLLVTVQDAIDEFRAVQALPGLQFGWELLDLYLRPGLQPSQLMVILARTGAGKTVFLLNMMHRARMVKGQEDTKILFISLEQTRGEWWDRARRIHRFYNLEQDEQSCAKFWENHLMLVDRNRITDTEVRQIFDDYEYQMGRRPDLICLDYLGYWARAFRGEAYERTSAAIMSLKALAKEYRIPMIVPHQVSRAAKDGEEFQMEAARDAGTIEETADFLLTMWRPDDAVGKTDLEKNGDVLFRIAKSRHGGRGAELRMQWSPVSLVLVPELDPLCARARREMEMHRLYGSENWDEIMFRHQMDSVML